MPLAKKFAPPALAALIIALFFGCDRGKDAGPPVKEPVPPSLQSVARPAPEFSVTALDGSQVSMSGLKGKVVVIDFWATWCPPCQASIPHLVKLQEKYRTQGLVLVGLSLDNAPDDLASFLKKQPVNYKVGFCPPEAKSAYRVSSIPRLFVVDKDGNIKGDFLGFSEQVAENIEASVVAALNR